MNDVDHFCDPHDLMTPEPCQRLYHGGYIHILLVIAIVVVLMRVISRRKPGRIVEFS